MEGFTVALALLDFVPVIAFGTAVLLLGLKLGNSLFFIGSVLSLLAGVMKATWKLILGICKKDVRWLNRPFLPMQMTGFIFMVVSLLFSLRTLSLQNVFLSVISLPQVLFFAVWILFLGGMVVYRKHGFKKDDATSNWIAEIINSIAQCALLAGVLITLYLS